MKLLASPTSPLCPQGAHRARREEDRVRAGRGLAVDRRGRRRRAQSAGQDPGAGRRGRHCTLYDSRVIVEYLDSVSPVSRLIPEPSAPADRGQALGSAGGRHLRCRRGDRRWSASGRPRSRAADWIDAAAAQGRARASAELARELGDKPWCNGEALFAGRHRDRLRARLPRLPPARVRLARRAPQPRATRREARQAPVVRRHRPAAGLKRARRTAGARREPVPPPAHCRKKARIAAGLFRRSRRVAACRSGGDRLHRVAGEVRVADVLDQFLRLACPAPASAG